MTLNNAVTRYGAIVDGKWADESKWCIIMRIPGIPGMSWVNGATGKLVDKIYCNIDMAGALAQSIINIRERELVDQMKTFDGCFMIRSVRGHENIISAHSYAMAIDINAATNQLGTDGDLSDELAECFTSVGFIWGKTFSRRDPMHMSFAGW